MKFTTIVVLVVCVLTGRFAEAKDVPWNFPNAKATVGKSVKLANGLQGQRVQLGGVKGICVPIDSSMTVLLRDNGGGSGPAVPNPNCLSCKIQAISTCSSRHCSPGVTVPGQTTKKCSDSKAFESCIADSCKDECPGAGGSLIGTVIMY